MQICSVHVFVRVLSFQSYTGMEWNTLHNYKYIRKTYYTQHKEYLMDILLTIALLLTLHTDNNI